MRGARGAVFPLPLAPSLRGGALGLAARPKRRRPHSTPKAATRPRTHRWRAPAGGGPGAWSARLMRAFGPPLLLALFSLALTTTHPRTHVRTRPGRAAPRFRSAPGQNATPRARQGTCTQPAAPKPAHQHRPPPPPPPAHFAPASTHRNPTPALEPKRTRAGRRERARVRARLNPVPARAHPPRRPLCFSPPHLPTLSSTRTAPRRREPRARLWPAAPRPPRREWPRPRVIVDARARFALAGSRPPLRHPRRRAPPSTTLPLASRPDSRPLQLDGSQPYPPPL
ncbi:MAG: hypothetical protein J3K34DRAFT_174224 [Monoraphidium minutum]|nr:MAG: hypothetical protein J3K34DRAFT_174224 [Monoraphidium minutum]